MLLIEQPFSCKFTLILAASSAPLSGNPFLGNPFLAFSSDYQSPLDLAPSIYRLLFRSHIPSYLLAHLDSNSPVILFILDWSEYLLFYLSIFLLISLSPLTHTTLLSPTFIFAYIIPLLLFYYLCHFSCFCFLPFFPLSSLHSLNHLETSFLFN